MILHPDTESRLPKADVLSKLSKELVGETTRFVTLGLDVYQTGGADE